jgi:hypothetical protein
MPQKPLTTAQIAQALKTLPQPTPNPVKVTPGEYDPALDVDLESFFNGVDRPAHWSLDNPWPPPNHAATDLYHRLVGVCLLGSSDLDIPNLPRFLSCLKHTNSEVVRAKALRATLYAIDAVWEKVSAQMVKDSIAAIEAYPELHDSGITHCLQRVKRSVCGAEV